MAEETDSEEPIPGNDLDSPDTKSLYANHTHMTINNTDVEIFFGFRPDRTRKQPYVFDQKIVINHTSFMKMMRYWVKRYTLLEEIYGGSVSSLLDHDSDIIDAAFDRMYDDGDTSVETDSDTNNEEE